MWESGPTPPALPPIQHEQAEETREPVPWRAREAVPVALLSVITGLVLTAIAAAFVGNDRDRLTAISILLSEVALAGSVLVWLRARYRISSSEFVGRRSVSLIGAGLFAGALGLIFAEFIIGPVIVRLVESIQNHPVRFPRQLQFENPSAGVLAITGIAVVLFAPFAEEALFRGLIYRGLRRWMRPVGAAVLSSAVFAAVHIHPLIMPAIFVLGLILARVVERHGSLVPSITAHALFNAVGFAVYLASR